MKKILLLSLCLSLGQPAYANLEQELNTVHTYLGQLAKKNGYASPYTINKRNTTPVTVPQMEQAVKNIRSTPIQVYSELTHIAEPDAEELSWFQDPMWTRDWDAPENMLLHGISNTVLVTDLIPELSPEEEAELREIYGDEFVNEMLTPQVHEYTEIEIPEEVYEEPPVEEPILLLNTPALEATYIQGEVSYHDGLLKADKDSSVDIRGHRIYIKKGGIIWQEENTLKALSGPGHIWLEEEGHKIKLNPGDEISFIPKGVKKFRYPDLAARRLAHCTKVSNGVMLTNEFNMASFMKGKKFEKKLFNKLLKTTAAVTFVTRKHGKYIYR